MSGSFDFKRDARFAHWRMTELKQYSNIFRSFLKIESVRDLPTFSNTTLEC